MDAGGEKRGEGKGGAQEEMFMKGGRKEGRKQGKKEGREDGVEGLKGRKRKGKFQIEERNENIREGGRKKGGKKRKEIKEGGYPFPPSLMKGRERGDDSDGDKKWKGGKLIIVMNEGT